MPVLDTQKALRPLQRLPFCYWCGRPVGGLQQVNVDHVPPSAIFLKEDRNFPLILPTHVDCNGERSVDDQLIGTLMGVLHRRPPAVGAKKPVLQAGKLPDGSVVVTLHDFDLRAVIRRWVRAFHAALYREFLPSVEEGFMTTTPLPEGEGGKIEPVPEVVQQFVMEIRRNRATGTLDRIATRNGKCLYECVWTQADAGQWMCVYALDIYNWIDLGDTQHFEARGCVGAYRRPSGGVPAGATETTRLQFRLPSTGRLDPFAP